MADSSFDISSSIETPELINTIHQTEKDIMQRFDLKDTGSTIEFKEKENKLHFNSSDEFKLKSIIELFKQACLKRKLSPRALQFEELEHALGGRAKVEASIQQGISQENAKKITKLIKDAKLKVKVQIQGDQLRVTGKKRDDLQAVQALIREQNYDFHFAFGNYR